MYDHAEILTIGAELLKGSTLNTNAQFLGRELTQLGFRVVAQTSCGDAIPEIAARLRDALSRSTVIILTGGLGPTPDDLTREAVASYFDVPLIFSKEQFANIRKYYRRHAKPSKRTIPDLVRKEALYPENAVPLINRFGIALGFYLRQGRQWIFVLPGVPAELEKMFKQNICGLLKKNFAHLAEKPHLVAKIVGLSEPEIMTKLGRDFFNLPFEFGIYPAPGEVAIRVNAEKKAITRELKQKIKRRLGGSVYAYEDISLAKAIGKILTARKKSLAVAESCTGGKLSAEITHVPGASRYFKGGVTVYSDAWKDALGVPKHLIQAKGAVSPEVALILAQKVRIFAKSTYGLGVTGIAGPSGGSKRKPVGLVYIAVAGPNHSKGEQHLFWGDRDQIRTKAAKKALEYLWRTIR